MTCRICFNNINNKIYTAREMMFGYKDKFEYVECSKCGCLQIKNQPINLSRYYPSEYYSFSELNRRKVGFFKRYLLHKRAEYAILRKGGVIGRFLALVRPLAVFYEGLYKHNINFESKILDAGCGAGELLFAMHQEGFNNLAGIDSYIQRDIQFNNIKILKKDIMDLEGIDQQFNLIMLHHSFEHMLEPLNVLKYLYGFLKNKGVLLIRMPVIGYAWRHYGVNWVQLDAPRHLYIHTKRSFDLLSSRAGFQLTDILYDSTEFQFWGSEQYVNDIPLRDKRSYLENPEDSMFSKKQMTFFKKEAIKLNKDKDGDQACFYLMKQQ